MCRLHGLSIPCLCALLMAQVSQPKLPLRTLDPRILPRGPDFTPAFADFGRQAPGGRNVSGSVSLPQLAHFKTGPNTDEVPPQAFGPLPMRRWFWFCQDECRGDVCLADKMWGNWEWLWMFVMGRCCLGRVCVLPVSLWERWKRFHTRTRQSRARSRVRRTTDPASARQPGGCAAKHTHRAKRFTNKLNTASTCVFLLSLCFHVLLWSLHSLFFHFSAAFLPFSLLLPVSGFAHPLKSPCEFFTHASAMSFPGAQVPPARQCHWRRTLCHH